MARLSAKDRQRVHDMFGGRCAYCGAYLSERWHVDHVKPILREVFTPEDDENVGEDSIDNMMPACPPCNISKGRMKLEDWRLWIAGHINSLNSYSSIYRISKAFGLLQETKEPVLFFFEKHEPAPAQKEPT